MGVGTESLSISVFLRHDTRLKDADIDQSLCRQRLPFIAMISNRRGVIEAFRDEFLRSLADGLGFDAGKEIVKEDLTPGR